MSKNGKERDIVTPQPVQVDLIRRDVVEDYHVKELRIDIQDQLRRELIKYFGEMVLMGIPVEKYYNADTHGLLNKLTASINKHEVLPTPDYEALNKLYCEIKDLIDPPKEYLIPPKTTTNK